MKKGISILLLLAMVLQICSRIGVVAWFNINQQELTELFCVNKSAPSKHCDGKCYLSKKLKETDSNETAQSKVPVKQKSGMEEVWFCEDHIQEIVYFSSTQNHPLSSIDSYGYQFSSGIFQPPQI